MTCKHENVSQTLELDGFLRFYCRDCGAGYDEHAERWSQPFVVNDARGSG